MYPIGSTESVVRCQDNGAWSNPREKCYKYCGSYPSVSHSETVERPSSPYTVDSVVKYKCDWLYAYDGKHRGVATVRCSKDGDWAPNVKCSLCISGIFGVKC